MSETTVSLPPGVQFLRGRWIDGVKVIPLRRIPDERGTIMRIMSDKDPWFDKFGEVYCSTIYEGVVKGWHKHRDMTLNYACVHGRVKCVVFDDRAESGTEGSLMEIYLGPDSYNLLVVPPDLWNGFKGLSAPMAMVVNCSTHAHNPDRSERTNPHADPRRIPYDWGRRDH